MIRSDFDITEIKTADSPLIASFITDRWSSPMSVSRGRIFNTADLLGYILKRDKEVIGLVTYKIDRDDCEIITLDSKLTNQGLASQLIAKVIEKARINRCKRVWLITTNDNTNAIRFYQKRGFEWIGFYKDSMDDSRKLKPEIPKIGNDDIPIKHELEFELKL